MRYRCFGGVLLLLLTIPALAQVPDPAPPSTPSAPETAPPAAPVAPDVAPVPQTPVKRRVVTKRPHPAPKPAKIVKARKPAKVAAPMPARAPAKLTAAPLERPSAPSGTWVKLNTHLIGTMGESNWVNLAQAANIRFYQTGKTQFASVGVGGSNYVSTSDPAEIQKLRAYVLAHQAR